MDDGYWAVPVEVIIVAPILVVFTVFGLGWLYSRMRTRTRNLERLLEDTNNRLEQLQRQFSRFAPADIVERLIEPEDTLPPNRRPVAVLFADLQGFTSLCERLDPVDTVEILNGYFQVMSEAIADHHGRVTELIGDGMLALFGALETNPWQAQDAVKGALAMRTALVRYNEHLRQRNHPELRFGIGIHQGEVLAGIMGNSELSKFAVVGDTINVAARVEALTRNHQVDLLITDEVRDALNDRYRLKAMPPTRVKGKSEPIVTYWVEGPVE